MRLPSTRWRTASGLAALALTVAVVTTPSATPVFAVTEGTLDTTFGTEGIVVVDAGGMDALHAVAIDGSGRIVVAGTSGTAGVVLRLLPDGSLDPSFGTSGRTGIPEFDARGVAITSDGRIVVVGSKSGDVRVVRLRSNGALDFTFAPSAGTPGSLTTSLSGGTDEAFAVALLSDDRILLAGRASNDLALVRYLTDGTLDTAFGGGDGITLTPAGSEPFTTASSLRGRAVAVEADGRILVAGDASGDTAVLVRYSATGTLVTPVFLGGNASPTAFRSLSLLDDGRVLAVGDYSIPADPTATPPTSKRDISIIARYVAALAIDTSIAPFGSFTRDAGGVTSLKASAIQEDGRFLVAGSVGNQFLLERYEADGDPDSTFGAFGGFIDLSTGALDTANAMVIQSDGNIVVVGAQGDDLLIARVLGTPVVAAPETAPAPSYDLSILDAPGAGTARLTRRDGTFVLPGSSTAAGRVTYTHEGLSATFLGTVARSAQGGLVGDGNGEVVVELSGPLTPEGVIEIWTASTPRLTAAHRITAGGADGEVQRFAVPLVAPLDGGGPVAGGAHVLQLVMPTTTGRQVLDVNLDVRDGVTGPVPTAIPAGSGPTGPVSPLGAGLLALALAGLLAVRAGRGSLRRPRAARAGAR